MGIFYNCTAAAERSAEVLSAEPPQFDIQGAACRCPLPRALKFNINFSLNLLTLNLLTFRTGSHLLPCLKGDVAEDKSWGL